MVVAHPYRRVYREQADTDSIAHHGMLDRAFRNKVFPMVDAVEVFNGRGSDQENVFSGEIAKQFAKGGTGASDAHKLDDLGTFATDFQFPVRSLDDLIRELKAGRFSPVALQKRINVYTNR